MPPPQIPDRTTSLNKAYSVYSNRERLAKQSRDELKRSSSALSVASTLADQKRVKMLEFTADMQDVELKKAQYDIELGESKIDRGTYEKMFKEANKEISSLQTSIWSEQKARRKLLEDAAEIPPLGPDSTDAFCAVLLKLYSDPDGKRSKTVQTSLRQQSIQYYSSDKDAPKDQLWCPFTKAYWDSEDLTCAHIVPHRLGEEIVSYIFGRGSGSRLNSVENTLMVKKSVEKLFDKSKFVLIPTDAKENPRKSWTIRLTSSDSMHRKVGAAGELLSEFEGKPLEFKNDKRPASRFLYFHFVSALNLAKRDRVHGYERFLRELPTGRPFATPGKYMRDSMVLALAASAGDLNEEEHVRLLGTPGQETFLEKERLEDVEEAEMARRALVAKSGADETDNGEEDDHDDDDTESKVGL